MNLQKIFEAVRNEPDQPTLIIAVSEIERQGYQVIINDKYFGSKELVSAEERNELNYLTHINGVVLKTIKNEDMQSFRIHYLDIDSIAFTSVEAIPIQYNPDYSIRFLKNNN